MRAFLIFVLIRTCLAFDLPRTDIVTKPKCVHDLNINNKNYTLNQTYPVHDAAPTDAHYDAHGNLFYVKSGQREEGYYFDIYMVKSKSTTPELIPGLPRNISNSVAVDKKNAKVYFGTQKGLYHYDYHRHHAILISEADLKLNMLFIDKDGNKYISQQNHGIEELFLYDQGKKKRISSIQALSEMAIDDKNNFYYIKTEKLYVWKSSNHTAQYIGDIPYDGMAQISIHEEKIFIASKNLTYFHENDTRRLKLVHNVPGEATAIAFDKSGDFALGVPGKILKYTKNYCDPKQHI